MTHTILASQDERSQQQEQQLLLSSSVNGNGGNRPPIVAAPSAGDPQGQPDPESLAQLSISIARSLEMRRRARREAQA